MTGTETPSTPAVQPGLAPGQGTQEVEAAARRAKRPESVAGRLNRRIIGWSLLLMLLGSAVQATLSWRHVDKAFKQAVSQIGASHVPLLSTSVWDIEHDAIKRQLERLQAQPEVGRLLLKTATGQRFESGVPGVMSMGAPTRFSIPQPLRPDVEIAVLEVTPNLSAFYEELGVALLPSMLGYVLLTGLILLLVRRVMRTEIESPLRELADKVGQLSPDKLSTPLSISARKGGQGDEIDQVVQGFRILQVSLNRHIQRGEQNLEEQLAFQRQLLDALPNPLFVKGPDMVFTAFNSAYEEAFGVRRDDILGKTVLDLDYLPVAEREAFQQADQALIAAGGQTTEEVLIRMADGGLHNVLYQRNAFKLPDGRPGGLIGTLIDITQRHRAERMERFRNQVLEQLAGDEPLRSLLESVVVAVEEQLPGSLCSVLLLDTSGRRLVDGVAPHLPDFYNQAIDGIEIGQGVGSCGTAAFTRERVIVEDIASHPYWAPYKELAAQARLAACWSEPIRGSDGQVLGTFAIYHTAPTRPDEAAIELISRSASLASIAIERSRTRETLARREAHLRTLVRTMPDLIWLKDIEGVYQTCNPRFEQFFGADEADIVGKTDDDFVPKELADRFREHDRAALQSGGIVYEEEMTFARGGHRGIFETVKTPTYDAQGRLLGVLGVSREITERKIMEQTLQQARQAAEAAAAAKGSFLANMSHEIRTPMNAIIGLTELALRTSLTPRQQDYLGKVHVAAHSLLGILNDILDLSKIESGKLSLERTTFNLDDVLDGIATVLAVQVEERGLELLFSRKPDVPTRLVGDPLRLSQVLTNLTGNARKFTERGDIVVSTELVAREGDEVTLRFAVRDSGIGMTPEQMERLFQPFSQADDSTTRRFGGTGLGLAISRQLVELMGGRIWVESQPGAGSTFTFEARFEQAAAASAGFADVAGDLQGLHALVVDDNPTAREILLSHLSQFSFRAETASSAEQALVMLQQQAQTDPYRLVLMDYRMPGMDGLTAARRIKREMGLPVTPRVVLVTAASRLAGEDEDDRSVLDEILAKPVNASLLFDVVMGVFGHQTRRPSRAAAATAMPDLTELQPVQGARILLVEDNAINQQVATELLQQAGFIVDVAEHGQAALDRLAAEAAYDLVLMDVQMPVMDGYTATARIRQNETFNQLPILAMTANVMAEDRARVLQVGMNDHISKPIVPQELFGKLLKWIPPGARPLPPGFGQAAGSEARDEVVLPDALPGVDMPKALMNVGGNRKLLQKLLGDFLQDHGDDVSRLEQAVESGDLLLAQRIAHTLKGVGGAIGAAGVQQRAGALEAALRSGRSQEADSLVRGLNSALQPVFSGLNQWVQAQGRAVHAAAAARALAGASALPGASSAAGGGLTAADPRVIRFLMDELQKLLQDMDPEAGDRAEALASLLPAHAGHAHELMRQAQAFDFEGALQTLQILRETLP